MYIICFLICSVAPTITTELMYQSINEGDTAYFTCKADGEPLPIISWYFNGALLNQINTSKYLFTEIRRVSSVVETLNIVNAQSSDAGTYTCNATNVVSTDTSSGVLTFRSELQFVLLYYSS